MALGLGAFVYSTVSKLFLSGDAGGLLNLLAISTSVAMLAGSIYVHVQGSHPSKNVLYLPLDGSSSSPIEVEDPNSSLSMEDSESRDEPLQSQNFEVHPDHEGSALTKPDFLILIIICGLQSIIPAERRHHEQAAFG